MKEIKIIIALCLVFIVGIGFGNTGYHDGYMKGIEEGKKAGMNLMKQHAVATGNAHWVPSDNGNDIQWIVRAEENINNNGLANSLRMKEREFYEMSGLQEKD